VREHDVPAAVVVKHCNPCGVATGATLSEAYRAAREADALSAFGASWRSTAWSTRRPRRRWRDLPRGRGGARASSDEALAVLHGQEEPPAALDSADGSRPIAPGAVDEAT
jgi:hypothetical protein